MEDNEYFEIIRTQCPDPAEAVKQHKQRLNNYKKYGFAGTNQELASVMTNQDRKPLSYKIEVHSMNTTSTMKGHDYVLVTVLCCENETYEEDKKEDVK